MAGQICFNGWQCHINQIFGGFYPHLCYANNSTSPESQLATRQIQLLVLMGRHESIAKLSYGQLENYNTFERRRGFGNTIDLIQEQGNSYQPSLENVSSTQYALRPSLKKYIPHTNMFDSAKTPRGSHIWKALYEGIQWLQNGMKWILGDGQTIRMWDDHQIPRGTLWSRIEGPLMQNEENRYWGQFFACSHVSGLTLLGPDLFWGVQPGT